MMPLVRAVVIAALIAAAVPWLAAGARRALNPTLVEQYQQYTTWVANITH